MFIEVFNNEFKASLIDRISFLGSYRNGEWYREGIKEPFNYSYSLSNNEVRLNQFSIQLYTEKFHYENSIYCRIYNKEYDFIFEGTAIVDRKNNSTTSITVKQDFRDANVLNNVNLVSTLQQQKECEDNSNCNGIDCDLPANELNPCCYGEMKDCINVNCNTNPTHECCVKRECCDDNDCDDNCFNCDNEEQSKLCCEADVVNIPIALGGVKLAKPIRLSTLENRYGLEIGSSQQDFQNIKIIDSGIDISFLKNIQALEREEFNLLQNTTNDIYATETVVNSNLENLLLDFSLIKKSENFYNPFVNNLTERSGNNLFIYEESQTTFSQVANDLADFTNCIFQFKKDDIYYYDFIDKSQLLYKNNISEIDVSNKVILNSLSTYKNRLVKEFSTNLNYRKPIFKGYLDATLNDLYFNDDDVNEAQKEINKQRLNDCIKRREDCFNDCLSERFLDCGDNPCYDGLDDSPNGPKSQYLSLLVSNSYLFPYTTKFINTRNNCEFSYILNIINGLKPEPQSAGEILTEVSKCADFTQILEDCNSTCSTNCEIVSHDFDTNLNSPNCVSSPCGLTTKCQGGSLLCSDEELRSDAECSNSCKQLSKGVAYHEIVDLQDTFSIKTGLTTGDIVTIKAFSYNTKDINNLLLDRKYLYLAGYTDLIIAGTSQEFDIGTFITIDNADYKSKFFGREYQSELWTYNTLLNSISFNENYIYEKIEANSNTKCRFYYSQTEDDYDELTLDNYNSGDAFFLESLPTNIANVKYVRFEINRLMVISTTVNFSNETTQLTCLGGTEFKF